MKLIIYGAKGYALSTYEAIKTLYKEREVYCFLVSDSGGNKRTLGGLLVKEIKKLSSELSPGEKKQIEVLIATPEDVQEDIEEELEDHGFLLHQRLTSKRYADLMSHFHTKLGKFRPLSSLPVGCSEPFLRLYIAKSDGDLNLRIKNPYDESFIPIHAGAALSNKKLSKLRDDTGENISLKNGNYSELTALYWIWKNKLIKDEIKDNLENERQYFGLFQYRRLLQLSNDDKLRLIDNDVDAILPYPLMYEPDINEHHKRYVKQSDFDALLEALHELSPEYASYFESVLKQRFLYNYNIIIAKKNVLKCYCKWLFPILLRTEELSEPKGEKRSDRYIGYLSESLLTLYFMKNSDRLNIFHTGCNFLI